MKCWHCDTDLIWGGDNDIDEDEEEWSIVSNLSCPGCGSFVEVYYPKKQPKKDFIYVVVSLYNMIE